MIQPSWPDFRQLATQGNLIPVYREIMADLDTPVSAFLKVAGEQPYAFLLESVQGGEKWGRYSMIGLDPMALFTVFGHTVEIREPRTGTHTVEEGDPMALLKRFMSRFQPVTVAGLPRFHGGAVGYFSYDMVRCFERIPDANPNVLGCPDAQFMLTDLTLIFDNLFGKLKVVVNVWLEPGVALEPLYRQALERIDSVVERLKNGVARVDLDGAGAPVQESDFVHETERAVFEQSVRQAKEYILAGDIFQVVLSHRLSIPFTHPPVALYRALRATNPSPYLYFLRLGDFSIVGSSPEILVRQEGQIATVRPIAGTRRRGADAAQDLALEQELLADPKEIAEHIMLVDLGRNDLGRVAVNGTVKVTEQFVVERYSHVMHIVSNVEARLKPGLDAFDLIAATFPAGTVSGAPKIRAMEIIDELECSRRGPYAGAVGYLSFSGNMDLAITLRTAVIKEGRLYVQAGAGVVADSIPEREYEETREKARAVLRAVDLVQRGLE
ncbi:MAG: anthranilate synthase component I [Magnetococcales bacterium]|nr:anthranilate synthase component I [Magnetococcales bacterium]NGZ06081.1 anthranilate synthase component I [Magnetococcales bacterium]